MRLLVFRHAKYFAVASAMVYIDNVLKFLAYLNVTVQ